MSKVIRTGRVATSGGVVTLGRAEEGLFYDPDKAPANPVDLPALLTARLEQVRSGLDEQWESRLRQEHETTRTSGERQLEEAQQAHQQELERVHQERYDEGHQDGVASKEAEATQAVERMAALHESLKGERSQILLDAENVVVDLALSLARRVVKVEAAADPRLVARTAREGLRHLSERSNLLLKVHPEDLAVARRFAAVWVERVDADAILRVQVSAHVDRGGCMIEGPEENVDARLVTQLDTLHEALKEGVMQQQHATDTAAVEPGAVSVSEGAQAAVSAVEDPQDPDTPTVADAGDEG